METRHTIGKLATRVGIPTSTVRYYERTGLLLATGRTTGNYRVYAEDVVDRVRFIRAAQATGFTLADIKELLGLRDGSSAPCAEVRQLIERRLANVEERMGEFRHVRHVLRSFLEACRQAGPDEPCHVMEKLGLGPSSASED